MEGLTLSVPADDAKQRQHMAAFLAEWKDCLADKGSRPEEETAKRLRALMHEKMTFYSPAVFTGYTDGNMITTFLKWVLEILQQFTYKHTTAGYDKDGNPVLVLFFSGTIVGSNRVIEGADFITLDKHTGKVQHLCPVEQKAHSLVQMLELKVMFRPLSSTLLFAEHMKKRLASL